MGAINDVQDQVCLVDLLQGSSKRGNQIGWQFLNEANRIRKENLSTTRQDYAACSRIQCGEELVLYQHIGPRQSIEQGRFSCIGIANNSNHRHCHTFSLPPVQGSVPAHLLKLFPDVCHAPADLPTVHLKLCLTRPPETHSAGTAPRPTTTGLTRQVGPRPSQPRQAILVLGQLYLKLALPGSRMLGKDVQDQAGSIEELDILTQRFLKIPQLPG